MLETNADRFPFYSSWSFVLPVCLSVCLCVSGPARPVPRCSVHACGGATCTHKVNDVIDDNEAAAFSACGRARRVQEYARASAGNALGRGKGETLYPLVNVNS